MYHRINTTCGSHRYRSRCEQLRIQDRIGRDQLVTENRQLIITAVIGDDRKSGHFGAGSCRSRHGDQRNDVSRHFVSALILRDASAVFCNNADRFCHIHRRTAAQCNDKVSAACLVRFRRFIYGFHGRIAFRLLKYAALDPLCFQCICTGTHNSHFI